MRRDDAVASDEAAAVGSQPTVTPAARSEARVRFLTAILFSSDDLIFYIDDAGLFREYFQSPTSSGLHVPPELFIGEHFSNAMPPKVADQFGEAIEQVRATGAEQRFGYMLPIEGVERWFRAKLLALPGIDGSPGGFGAAVREVTDHLSAERALKTSEQAYQRLFEGSNDALCVADESGRITLANQAWRTLFGYHELAPGELELDTLLEPGGGWASLWQDVSTQGSSARRELELRSRDGELVVCLLSVTPILEGAALTGCQLAFYDITKERALERERADLREKLKRAERMESLGILAGGVAHDLNNILGPLVAYPDLILEDLTEGTEVYSNVLSMQQSAERAAAVVGDLLTLARRGRQEVTPLSLGDVIRSYIGSSSFETLRRVHPDVVCTQEVSGDLAPVEGSFINLTKVLMNLTHNAFEAIGAGGGRVVIRARAEQLAESHAGYDTVPPGDYVVMEVSDTGSGIGDVDMHRIFEPFYTSKEMGRSGTGLGLAIVWGVIKDHGGYIDVRAALGGGTAFSVFLPRTQAQPCSPPVEAAERGQGETILVVDDDRAQRDLASQLLGRLGYHVTTVSSGEAAIERARSERPDLVILDMLMGPGLDGLDTYKALLAIDPQQRALVATGYAETERVQEAIRLGVGACIKKPYSLSTIGIAVRNELKR